VIVRNPVARIRRPKTGHDSPRLGLDVEQVRQLLRAAAVAGPRDGALASLLLHCGLRVSEALGLTVGDLSTSRGHRTARVVRKGGAVHQVPLPAPAAHAVDALLADRGLAEATGALVDTAPLFIDAEGQQLDRSTPAGSSAAWRGPPASARRSRHTPCATASSPWRSTPACRSATSRTAPATPIPRRPDGTTAADTRSTASRATRWRLTWADARKGRSVDDCPLSRRGAVGIRVLRSEGIPAVLSRSAVALFSGAGHSQEDEKR
jgi:hypothetical protein